ncbi:MAG TPA: dihydroorotate dehydrogenase [Acidimicrobiia bacterium]|nr:dihydroorotate dehydrogenase [Acidimicrobiia bacterium]
MTANTSVRLGALRLSTPLVAASGTVGSVWEFARVADVGAYGAMTAKSVSGEPWEGRPPPRLAPAGLGMLNGIGIQNPGIERWVDETAPRLQTVGCQVWGSAVGTSPEEFARVAGGLGRAGVAAVEVNLSCPNLESGRMFALEPEPSRKVMEAVKDATDLPVGAKLSPNSTDIVAVAAACREGGADWVTLTNTISGAGIDVDTGLPLLSGGVGGYSGPPLKPISLRCVMEVALALPGLPILGCGGVSRGTDVVEYLMAGAAAVALGTIHFAEPRAARRILDELTDWCDRRAIEAVSDLTGAATL